ncbi:MAG: enoyl-CoA hydratase/isomerase family protein [Desulfobacteraceae bacterium]|nr:enoyl-CoA hydratase/isomerase family protein [Desulfobacteraceae bacterium]
MGYENIVFEVQSGIGVLTINRPRALNALNPQTFYEMSVLLERVREDARVRVLVLTGAGEKAFVAGADIKVFPSMTPLQGRQFAEKGQRVFSLMEELPIPVIACVNGFALGGGFEAALACDFIYASETARFGFPEVTLGLVPGFGGTQRLPRLIGRARAKELCMSAEMIDARRALEMGLVARVFPADRLFEETMKMAGVLTSRGPNALRSLKRVIDRGADGTFQTGCALEAEAFGNCFGSRDMKEGVSAFLEKRLPVFRGSLSD